MWRLLLLVLLLAAGAAGAEDDARVSDLVRRQAGAKDGVIVLDDEAVRYLVASPNRPYALLVFFDATQLRERSDLKLDELRAEFGLVASAYVRKQTGESGQQQLFFCWIEFQQSQASFAAFGVNSLPHIRLVAPGSGPLNASQAMDMEAGRSAEGMAGWVESRVRNVKVGGIQRPPVVSRRQMALAGCVLAVVVPLVVRRVVLQGASTPLHSAKVWCAAALLVYFFSVSGGMHNIIRKMPLFMLDRNDRTKLVFFYQGSGMQLGAEGFAVGFLYTLLGLALASVTHLLLWLSTSTLVHRAVMLISFVLAFWSVAKVVTLDNWKTGYQVHPYFPNRWL